MNLCHAVCGVEKSVFFDAEMNASSLGQHKGLQWAESAMTEDGINMADHGTVFT
jgi:hypothetical protein